MPVANSRPAQVAPESPLDAPNRDPPVRFEATNSRLGFVGSTAIDASASGPVMRLTSTGAGTGNCTVADRKVRASRGSTAGPFIGCMVRARSVHVAFQAFGRADYGMPAVSGDGSLPLRRDSDSAHGRQNGEVEYVAARTRNVIPTGLGPEGSRAGKRRRTLSCRDRGSPALQESPVSKVCHQPEIPPSGARSG